MKEINAMQDRMDSMASDENRLKADGKKADAKRMSTRLEGALQIAEAMDVYCNCFHVIAKKGVSFDPYARKCVCARTLPGMLDKQKKTVAAYRLR